MPGFEKSSPEVVARFDELTSLVPDAVRKPMFGYPALFMNGNLFFSLHENRAILRMPEADRDAFGSHYELRLFEPMAGRPMREYVVVPPELFASAAVEPWIERAASYARTLAPKQPRAGVRAHR